MNPDKLQSDLAAHDASNWLHEDGFETDTHNFLHVAKTAGKIAAHLEAIDDHKKTGRHPTRPNSCRRLSY